MERKEEERGKGGGGGVSKIVIRLNLTKSTETLRGDY